LAIPFGNPAIERLPPQTGGFASPPLGGFALSLSKKDRALVALFLSTRAS